ncbi:MAG: hypothetical protein A3D19_06395 [Deltaproteobacteria bacterium RIFCSPHIGHO2_02_FULL_38_15]|nr:MAG: hypothetical protein A3D19_06395 [Deltaproteobacteria bacterium RIFCSPHIGHO2_02_FULL_38_15]OGQ35129.1 MAG: hypothetical protein A3A72_03790 [Deltaproteobacteria bacterium RIFCSPLOWO2_01_FULL_38_9]
MRKKKSVSHHILLVGLKTTLSKVVQNGLQEDDFILHEEFDLTKALKAIARLDISLVVLDQDTYITEESLEFSKRCTSVISHPSVILLTENTSIDHLRLLFQHKVHDCLIKPFKMSELFDSIKRGLEYRQTHIYGVKDALTGLYNRYAFKEILRQEIERAQRYDRHLSLLMIDIDHFKRVNDMFGHLIGDHILEELSRVIQSAFRKTDTIARFGGEEFSIILPETTVGHATLLAERIRKKIEGHDYSRFIKKERLTVSIGISNYHTPGRKSDITLIHSADQALYTAKKEGRNKVVLSR